jgi:hypothetical protein
MIPTGGAIGDIIRLVVLVIGTYWVILWLSAIIWTYRDVRERTRDPISQAISVLLVVLFSIPGLFIYLILRPRESLADAYERSLEEEALLQELEDQRACPTCRRRVEGEFVLCPYCRTKLKDPCGVCGRPLSYGWIACPFCGMSRANAVEPDLRLRQPTVTPLPTSSENAGEDGGSGLRPMRARGNPTTALPTDAGPFADRGT